MTLPWTPPTILGSSSTPSSSTPPTPPSGPLTFPSGPMPPLAASQLLNGIDEHLFVTNDNGSVPIQFWLKGPFSPCAPGLPGQDGIVLQSVEGMAPNFKHKDLQAATQDGVTWTDTVYDPAEITLVGQLHAATPQGLTNVLDAWMGAWNPKQQLIVEHISLDGGYWRARARLNSTWLGPIKNDRRFLYRPLTHKFRIDDAFWEGVISMSTWAPTPDQSFGEEFDAESGSLSSSWTVTYSSGHTGSIVLANGIGAYWSDTGNSTQSVEAIYTTQTATDYQIVTIRMGGAWEGFNLGGSAYNDIWARVDGAGNGILCRIGTFSVAVYRFNSGVPTQMYWMPLRLPPLPNESWTFFCGANPAAGPRNYALWRGAASFYSGAWVLGFAEPGTGSVVGSSARGTGWGMVTANTAGGMLYPVPLRSFSAGDNPNAGSGGYVTLCNIGTEDGWPDYTLYGPGTFDIADLGRGTVSIGPLASGQVAQVTTLPRIRSVVDVNNPSNNLYPLMNGRFSTPIPGVALPNQAQSVQIPVAISGASGVSSITATLTPRRVHPT